jgi:hypothetical protein
MSMILACCWFGLKNDVLASLKIANLLSCKIRSNHEDSSLCLFIEILTASDNQSNLHFS